jgi:TM2 domain-containing membrane protein YozV
VSPGLAFLLGLIPGVGAIYNGQYAKGIVHALILGFLISIMDSRTAGSFGPMLAVLMAAFYIYMPFEAYHTAVKRQRGEPVDEFSSVLPLRRSRATRGFPVGPILLMALGVLFLLDTMEWVHIGDILRFWPIFLIGLGGYMLYLRVTDREEAAPQPREAGQPTGVEQ